MVAIEGSYLQKLRRAKKHLVELKREVRTYSDSHPYEVVARRQGKKQRNVHLLVFTRDVRNTMIPIVMSDIIYNLRSALDHLAASLVPKSQESSVSFPVFFRGVWEPDQPGDSEQVLKDRQRWITYTRHMHPDAVAYLRGLQPDFAAIENMYSGIHLLTSLNNLSNVDRHRRLPVVVGGFDDGCFSWHFGDPTQRVEGVMQGMTSTHGVVVPRDETLLSTLPKGAMDVQFHGTAGVSIEVGRNKRGPVYIPIASSAEQMLHDVRLAITRLIPYLDH